MEKKKEFEVNTRIRYYWNYVRCIKYQMLSICLELIPH